MICWAWSLACRVRLLLIAVDCAALLMDWGLLWLPELSTAMCAAAFTGTSCTALAVVVAVCAVRLVWLAICDEPVAVTDLIHLQEAPGN